MVDDIIISGLLEQTAQAHRVIVFDRPGFGHSERPRGGLVLASGYYYREPRADVMLPSAAATPVLGDVICHTAGPLLGEVMTSAVLRKMFAHINASAEELSLRYGMLELAGSKLDIFQGAGHMTHHFDPRRVVRAIDEISPAVSPGSEKVAATSTVGG